MAAGASYRCDGEVLDIVLYRADRRNALGAAEWAVLDAAIAEAERGASNVVVLRAEGDFFCAGVDLNWMEEASQAGNLLDLIESNGETLRRLENLPQIVLVAINGPALGIGAHLALCGDIVLATRRSYLCFPEARLGIPDVLHFQLLERRLGRSVALDMMLLGQRLAAEDAERGRVFGHVYDDAEGLQRAVSDYQIRLRAVDPAVRRAVKSAAGARSDIRAQLDVCVAVLGKEGKFASKSTK
jgi:enoyl-CoA hydratase/carnithine racemase